jgi:hypothetical protein
MIIAHCPQFISPDFPKMINFECIEVEIEEPSKSGQKTNSGPDYNIARIDLGMSRCFDYNKKDNFLYYLGKNYNRKMSILKIKPVNNKIIFNTDNIVSKKISCVQYLLIKYGINQEQWEKHSVHSNWLGFEHIEKIMNSKDSKEIGKILNKCKGYPTCQHDNKHKTLEKDTESESSEELSSDEIILCLLSPVLNKNLVLDSINQFSNLVKLNQKN